MQGALGWIWGRSGITVPIPGFKSRKQVEELTDAASFGPLDKATMKELDGILSGLAKVPGE